MANTAILTPSPNSYGRVAQGEGSGQSQVLDSYDSTKFDRAIVAQDEEKKKIAAKNAPKFTMPKTIEIDKWWIKDAIYYQNEARDLENTEVGLWSKYYKNNRDIKNPDERYAANSKVGEELALNNSKKKALNQEIDMGWENQEILEDAQSSYKGNTTLFDKKETAKRYKEFGSLEGREELVDELGAQGARQYILENEYDGTLLKDKFNYAVYQAKRRKTYAGFGKETTTGSSYKSQSGDLMITGKYYDKTYNFSKIKQSELSSLTDYSTYIDWVRDDRFKAGIMTAHPKAKSSKDITDEQVLAWAETSPEFDNYIQVELMPLDEYSYTSTSKQIKPGGSGVTEIDPEADLVVSDLETIFEETSEWGKFLKNFGVNIDGKKKYNLHGVNAQQVSKYDQVSANATITIGTGTKIMDQGTGKDVTEKIRHAGGLEEDGTGVTINTFIAARNIHYRDKNGDSQTFKAGDSLPETATKKLFAAKDYHTVSRYYTTGIAQGSKNLRYIVVQDTENYSNMRKTSKDTNMINSNIVRVKIYNESGMMVEGLRAGDWVQQRANGLGGNESDWKRAEREATRIINNNGASAGDADNF